MKKLLALAAFLLASGTAQAQYTFRYGGTTIRVDPDQGAVSIYDNSERPPKHTKRKQARGSDKVERPAPAEALATPAPAPQGNGPAAQPSATPSAPSVSKPADSLPPGEPANNTPGESATSSAPQLPGAPVQDTTEKPAPPPAIAAVPPLVAAAPAAPASVSDPHSPIGVWLTQEKEGKVRIEQCGANLCGYSVDAKSSTKGEEILIDMKPGKNMKWSGRIVDPNTGSTYDSTIALKGADTLRVEGCALGGMFCGGQTWHRSD